jgi:hypothetical protein
MNSLSLGAPRIALAVAALFVATLTAACDGEAPCLEPGATRPLFDPSPGTGHWLAHPFPSDHRRGTGGVRLDDFPNPYGAPFVDDYLFAAEDVLGGFALNGPGYVAFDGPIDPTSLPADPAAFLEEDAPLQLIDVDPASPERGRRFPLRWQYLDTGDAFRPPHTLAVASEWGFPLRGGTSYALVVTRALLDASGQPVAPSPLAGRVIAEDDRCEPAESASVVQSSLARLEPLRDLFSRRGLSGRDVAAATVFTTEDATFDVAAMRAVIHDLPAPSVEGWRTFEDARTWYDRSFDWQPNRAVAYYVLEGRFSLPYFLEGQIPYNAAGGAIHRVDGLPAPVRQESVRFVLTVPAVQPPAGGCHPLVQYAHGTGGDAYGFSVRTAGRLAGRGLAGIGLDQPLHGERTDGRSFDPSLMTFNIANPLSTRSIMRQSAADTFALTRLVRNDFHVPAAVSPTGQRICFEVESGLFFGHSQGGITGSMAAAFETDLRAFMLSGSGGGVAIGVLQRKSPLDFADLVRVLAGLPEGEVVDAFHPLTMLVQSLTEVTDPINYAPRWLVATDGPRHFLVTSGALDDATPYPSALAKSVAAGIPMVRPTGTDNPWHDLAGLTPVWDPVSGNVGEATAGHVHLPNGDHFLVFDTREGIHASMHFLETAASGTPVIVRDSNANVR